LGILGLVLAGGVMYSGGIAFYIADFKYSHFIWHFFVIFGTICKKQGYDFSIVPLFLCA